MPIEHEAKFVVHDFAKMHQQLLSQATLLVPWHLEKNTIYDQNGELKAQKKLLRVRQAGPRSILTLKSPVPSAGKNIKSRQEIECDIDDPLAMNTILAGLGFDITAHYEKFRSIWNLGQGTGYLDLLPFGHFLEIEAAPEDISILALSLGLNPEQAIDKSYIFLYNAWCAESGLSPASEIVFTSEEKKLLAHKLSCTIL